MAENKPEEKPLEEGKKEEKKPTTLDSILKESSHAVKSSFNTSLGLGAIGGATALFGLDGLVTAASFPVGGLIERRLMKDSKPFTAGDFAKESIAGALFTPALWYGLEAIKKVPKTFGLDGVVTNILGTSMPISPLVVGGLALGALTPALTALYYPLQYVIHNKTFKGLGKDFRENYWKGFKRTLPLTALTSAAIGATYALPYLAPYLFPALAVANVAYRVLLSKENLNYLKLLNPLTYVPNFLNPFYLVSGAATAAYKTGKGVFEAASAVGSTLYDKIKNFFKAATAIAPAEKKAA